MPRYIAVDPGGDTGWAVFDAPDSTSAPTLLACGLAQEGGKKYPPLDPTVYRAESSIIEIPQVYAAAKSKVDPNDLIVLALLAGQYHERLARAGARVCHVLPREWKGQVSKEVNHARTRAELSRLAATGNASLEHFQACMTPIAEGLRHNVMDAVGIGLAAFKKGLWPR